MVYLNFQFMTFNQFLKIWNSYPQKTNFQFELEREFPINLTIFKILNSYPQKSKFEFERGSTWISNSWHLINFSNLHLLSTENKFWTWKRVNLNNGQLEFPIHDIQSIFKIWNSYPQKQNLNLNLKEGQLEFPIHDIQLIFQIWNSYPHKIKFGFELERRSTCTMVNLNLQLMAFN